jgi:hypothetical protein
MTSAGDRPWRASQETKSFILTSCFTGGCWTITVTVVNPWPISPYPVVFLQGRESGGYCFIECLRCHLYGVLNVSNILHCDCARSKNHVQKVYHVRLLFATPGNHRNRSHCIPLPVLRPLPHVFPRNEFVLQFFVKLVKLFRSNWIA